MAMHDSLQKKIVAINLGNFGSTGTIMDGICKAAEKKGYITYQAYPEQPMNKPKQKNDIIITNKFSLRLSKKLAYKTGYNGCFAVIPTIIFLRKLSIIKPDIIHLHNLHNSYINLPLLFWYIKKTNSKVVWTLHDCWAFTGHCPHFTIAKCNRWKTGCYDCPQPECYPRTKRDKSREMWRLKKKWFNKVEAMTIVTPSKWLSDIVEKSFLCEYPLKVINNGIDPSIFYRRESNVHARYHLKGQYVILGVSFDWGERKGLDVFIQLSSRLDDRFTIVLIGTNDEIDKQLPEKICSIHRTTDREELAQVYSCADVFVNPTREENFPTVNMEALACGTPVLTFKTGGSPEIPDSKSGYVVDVDDIEQLEKQIRRICVEKPFSRDACIERSKSFDISIMYEEYIDLYDYYSTRRFKDGH